MYEWTLDREVSQQSSWHGGFPGFNGRGTLTLKKHEEVVYKTEGEYTEISKLANFISEVVHDAYKRDPQIDPSIQRTTWRF